MNKFVLPLIILVLFSTVLHAQRKYSSSNRKAISYFEQGYNQYSLREYDKALEYLNQAIDKDEKFIEAYIIKGQVFEAKGNYEKAINSYQVAIGIDRDFYPLLFYSIGVLHLNTGNYNDAKASFEQFLQTDYNDPAYKEKARMRIEDCNFAIRQVNNPVEFEPENIGEQVNSRYNDYWPSLSADGKTMVITRLIPVENAEEIEKSMKEMSPSRRQLMLSMNPTEQEDFFVSYQSDTGWIPAKNLGDPLNTDNNEGAQSLSADGETMYFSACNRSDGKGGCDIYVSHKKNGAWSKPENLGSPVNTGKWESQPSISPDGRTLYFASNRKGGKGGKDIWISTLKEDSSWSKPINLGDSVNTLADDLAPFIHMDNKTLYFSSNGWPGMGNLDLFKTSRKSDTAWTTPKNLGYPINTHKNEVGLIVNSFGSEAYYASNRKEGYKKDIYTFDLPRPLQPISSSYMKGRVYDANTEKPLRAEFELISMKNEEMVMNSFSDGTDGEFLVSIPTNNNYVLNVSKEGYLFYSDNFQMEGQHEATEPFVKDIPLKPIREGEKIILRNVFYELDSYELKSESKVELNKLYTLLKNNPTLKIEISGHTDNTGSRDYNMSLSENRARSVYNYLINKGIREERLTYKGYGESQPIATNETEEGRALNRRTEIKVIEK